MVIENNGGDIKGGTKVKASGLNPNMTTAAWQFKRQDKGARNLTVQLIIDARLMTQKFRIKNV